MLHREPNFTSWMPLSALRRIIRAKERTLRSDDCTIGGIYIFAFQAQQPICVRIEPHLQSCVDYLGMTKKLSSRLRPSHHGMMKCYRARGRTEPWVRIWAFAVPLGQPLIVPELKNLESRLLHAYHDLYDCLPIFNEKF
jgi:hypothetical protein